MFLINDISLSMDAPFKDANGVQYPANWLRLASAIEKAAIGITEVADPEPYDDRFYWGVGNPKDLDQCKANLISQVKATAASLLSPSDWKVIRATETGIILETAVKDARAAIRTASNANEAAINACTSVDQLAALQFTWPE